MKQLIAGLSALFLFMVLGTTVSMAQSGSPAWSIRPLVLLADPSHDSRVVGHIATDKRIRVDRCSRQWCHVHAGRQAGWTSLYLITFGAVDRARLPFSLPSLHRHRLFGY